MEGVEYALGTFQRIALEDDRAGGEGRTRQLVLAGHDRLRRGWT